MAIKISGNDIELNGNKVARLFDISGFQREDILNLFDKANNYVDDMEKAYEDGKRENE
jgi:hypothetical protein